MAVDRSPRYPSVSLKQAVEYVRAIFRKEGRGAIPPLIAVKALGYSTMSGTARTRLGALKQYGLVDDQFNGPVKLSSRGLTLAIRSADSPEYLATLQEAALTPLLFREIYERRGDASDDALRHYLIAEKKFAPNGADRFVEAFRETLRVAKLDNRGYGVGEDDGEETRDMNESWQDAKVDRGGNAGAQAVRYSWPLPGNRVAELTVRGGLVSQRDLQAVRDYLAVAEKYLPENGGEGGD
jgi:hypothetical protein